MVREDSELINVDVENNSLRTFILFVQTADAVSKYADTSFYKKAGLSAIKFTILKIIAVNGGTMTPSEIANWTLTRPHNITTMTNRLKRDGLVTTKRSRSDKRFINITLTHKGHEIIKQTGPVAREIVSQIMSSITKSDTVALEKLLTILRHNAHNGLG